jgi:hypothetical protein
MSDQYLPGMGTAIGLAWAEADAKDQKHSQDLERIRQELLQKSKTVLYQTAFKHAAADVLEEIVDELRQDEAGALEQRRMSDPKNAEARNEAYAQAAAKHVTRLSGGKVRMSRRSMDRIKNDRTFR